MVKSVRTLVFTPVGPASKLEHVRDTVESFIHYIDQSNSVLLLINDTGRSDIHETLPKRANILIFDSPPRRNVAQGHVTAGNLFANQILALRHVTGLFDWKYALRLDDDALIIGPRPEVDALGVFEAGHRIGLIGAYRYRGDGTNKEADMAVKGRQVLQSIFSTQAFKHPRASAHLLNLVVRSRLTGHRLGHLCTGGAMFMSRAAYDRTADLVGPDPGYLRGLTLEDDLLFAVHCGAAGFKFADFSRPQDVMAVNWRGLPMPLEELVRRGKKIVHPVKEIDRPEHETRVRAFFKGRRA